MQKIEFTVANQQIRWTLSRGSVIEQSRGVVHADFSFDAEWDGCSIVCIFANNNAGGEPVKRTWTGLPIEVPPQILVTGRLLISCVGIKDGGNYKITTMDMSPGIRVYRSGNQIGVVPEPVEPSMIEQLMAASALATDAADRADRTSEDLTAAAERGDFDGKDGHTPQKGVDYGTPEDLKAIMDEVLRTPEFQGAANDAAAAEEAANRSKQEAEQAGLAAGEAVNAVAVAGELAKQVQLMEQQVAQDKSTVVQLAGEVATNTLSATDAAKAAKRSEEGASRSAADALKKANDAAGSSAAAEKAKQEAEDGARRAETAAQNATGEVQMHNESPDAHAGLFRKAWKEAVDSLAPEFRQTGPIVQGHPVPRYPMEIISHIEPWQEGTGDPSPTNVRPIHGCSTLKVTRCGENLFDKNNLIPSDAGSTFELKCVGNVYIKLRSNISNISAMTVIADINDNVANYKTKASIGDAYPSGIKWLFSGTEPSGTVAEAECTVPVGKKLWVVMTPTIKWDNDFDGIVSISGKNVTSYDYSGETYTKQLPEEVFGGEFDWKSGELPKSCDSMVFTGEERIVYFEAKTDVVRIAFNLPSEGFSGLKNASVFSHFKTVWNNEDFPHAYQDRGGVNIFIPVSVLSELTQNGVIEWLRQQKANGTPLQCAYQVETPKIIQLPPTLNILANDGVTTVYSNSGDTTVIARSDPSHISKLQDDRIAALERAIMKL